MKIPISVCFSIFFNNRKGIKESSKRPGQNDHGYACLAKPVLVSNPVENDYQKPIILPDHPKVLLSTEGQINPLIQNSSLRLLAWLASGKIYLQKECQKGLSTLSQMPEEQVFSQITNRPGESLLARDIENELIPLEPSKRNIRFLCRNI